MQDVRCSMSLELALSLFIVIEQEYTVKRERIELDAMMGTLTPMSLDWRSLEEFNDWDRRYLELC